MLAQLLERVSEIGRDRERATKPATWTTDALAIRSTAARIRYRFAQIFQRQDIAANELRKKAVAAVLLTDSLTGGPVRHSRARRWPRAIRQTGAALACAGKPKTSDRRSPRAEHRSGRRSPPGFRARVHPARRERSVPLLQALVELVIAFEKERANLGALGGCRLSIGNCPR